MTIPDFSKQSEEEFEDFLKGCPLSESQKNSLKSASLSVRHELFSGDIQWHELNESETARTELQNYLVLNSIFMTNKLRMRFREVSKNLHELISLHADYLRDGPNPDWRKRRPIWDETTRNPDFIETEVQKRLRYDKA